MTKKQINKAAKLYFLSQIALLDTGGAETKEEELVISRAIEMATRKLEMMHFAPISTLAGCIEIIERQAVKEKEKEQEK